MKGNMMSLALLWLLLLWMTPEGSAVPSYDKPTPLSMEENSVDDMYDGCRKNMMNTIKTKYLKKEKKDMLWDEKSITACTKEKVEDNMINALTADHLRALCIYTGGRIYKEFTPAVIAQRNNYGSSFKYHSLHYLLTTAIQILRPNKDICYTVYRRTNYIFTGEVNQIIRFGLFASTSLKPNLKPESFGSNTCFKVKTCSGAYLTNYAIISEQKEVLIPPYERFKITQVYDGQGRFAEMKDCRRVFVLESIREDKSFLNCKLAPKDTE